MSIARIAVEKTLYRFDKAFDYSIPMEYEESAWPGCRVLVPFGTSNSKRMGMILERLETEPDESAKEIEAVLDPAPLLTQEMLFLVSWIKGRYFCTLFDAVKLLLPSGINYQLRFSYGIGRLPQEGSLSPEEARLVAYLLEKKEPVEKEKLLKVLQIEEEPSFLEKLVKEGILQKSSSAVRRIGDHAKNGASLLEEKQTKSSRQNRKKLLLFWKKQERLL